MGKGDLIAWHIVEPSYLLHVVVYIPC